MYYFAYGMNTNKSEMTMRCPNAEFIGVATLYNHQFRFAGHADIIKSCNDHVDGALWKITDDCLHNLDILEGYPNYYNRKIVTVESDSIKFIAWTYYMNNSVSAMPLEYYWNCVCEGYTTYNIPKNQLYRALNDLYNQNLTNNQDFDILRS